MLHKHCYLSRNLDSYCVVFLGPSIAQAVSHWPPTAETRISTQDISVGFVGENVALGQIIIIRVLLSTPVSIV